MMNLDDPNILYNVTADLRKNVKAQALLLEQMED